MTRARHLPAFLLAVSIALAGCATDTARSPDTPPPGTAPPRKVIAAIQGDPGTLSAAINSAGAGRVRGVSELEMLIHTGLSLVDHRGIRISILAEDVPSIDNGLWLIFPDGRMQTTWRIRTNARWHDGTPFTTEDLRFTVQVSQDKDLAFLGHSSFDLIEGLETGEGRVLTIAWKRPFIAADALFSYDFGLPLARHLLEPSYLGNRAAFAEIPYWTTDFVGAGAFRLREFVRGSHLTLIPSETYVLGKPKIDSIEVRFIPDLNVFVAHLLAGEVELALCRSLSLEQVEQLRERWGQGNVSVAPATSRTALFPQHTNPIPALLGEVQMRRALFQAIDRQQLVDVLLGGLVPVAHSIVSPVQPEFDDVQRYIVRYDFDPRQAARAIETFGYTRGPDGLVRDASGEQLSVEVRSTGGDDFRDKMLFTITDDWKRIGVNAEPVIIPRQRASDREYRVTRPAFELVNQPTELRGLSRFHSKEMPTAENSYRGDNRARYASAELDGLLDRVEVTIPRAERTRILGDIVRHMTERLVVLDIHYSGDVAAAGKRIRNVLPGDPWNSHEWQVD